MDLISTRTIDITKLAMDGIMARQKAISANTANVVTPGYKRQDVSFESQLKEIVAQDDLKTMIKEQNSVQYNPTALDLAMGRNNSNLTPQQVKYLQTDLYSTYNPQVTEDFASGSDSTGNNVSLEEEAMDMAKTGSMYAILANLEQKQFRNIADVIKGGTQ